jgi:iron complex outermembrane recepter protein
MKKLLLPILSIFGINSYSQNITDSIISIKEIEVIKTYRADDKTPVTQKTINYIDITRININQDVPSLISKTPSMTSNSDNGAYGGYTYMRLRGIDQTRINMTLNGVPMNEPEDQGVYFNNLPDFLNSINSLQIQRGVGTSTNGTSSYIGSINFESININTEKSFGSSIDYGSFNSKRITGYCNQYITQNIPIYIRISGQETDGYKYHSGNKSCSFFISSGYFNKNDMIKTIIIYGNQNNNLAWIGVPLDSIKKDRKYNSDFTDETDYFKQFHSQINYTHLFNEKTSLNNTLYFNHLNGSYYFDLNAFLLLPKNTIDSSLYNYYVKSNFIGFISNYSYKTNILRFYTGFHLNTYEREHIGSESKIGNLYDNTGYKNEASIFSKLLIYYQNFTFFGDLQYRYTDFSYKGSVKLDKIYWDFFNPKIGLVYNIDKHKRLYYSLGKTGREPTRTDMFGGNENLDNIGEFTNIKPEYVIDNEIGYVFNNSIINFQSDFFYMNFKNEIVLLGQFGSNGLALHNNVSDSRRYGLEFDIDWKLDKFRFINSSSFSKNEILESNNITIHVLSPEKIINQNIIYSINNIDLNIMFRYQDKSYIDYTNKYYVNGYNIIDFGIKKNANKFIYGININNILNTKYLSTGMIGATGVPLYFVGTPINFNLFLKIKI